MESNKLNETQLLYMYGEIRALESSNIKTNKFDDKSMVQAIIKIIEKYVKELEQ